MDLYDGAIMFVDHWIGKLESYLEERGLLENTLLVIGSDHGDEFYEHGFKHHANHLYSEVLRVPLIFAHGGLLYREPIPFQVRNIDIGPTILEYSLGEVPESFCGKSLLPIILKKKIGEDLPALSQVGGSKHHAKNKDFIALTTTKYKLIWERNKNKLELYDLENDPKEKRNLKKAREVRERMLQEIKDYISSAAQDSRIPLPGKASENDEELKATLRSLGYLD
jgi:arylsulfatase A-like enzyme